ncbi:MAG: ABC transporter substrate-binding protein [Myxococcales bacterium]|nr:ABC transporter substrate-binding protein [Myxococcales bacterium]
MRKPEHRWQIRRHQAVLEPGGGGGAHDERFVLNFFDGPPGRAWLRLDEQRVDAIASTDPDLPHAVRCWLAARGCFVLELVGEDGRVLARGPFSVDDLGDPPASEPARRLVTLAPSNAELVDALGAFDRVVACEDSTDRPPEAAERVRLGPDLGPDLDRVAQLGPDLVVSSLSVPGMERVVVGLRARGLPQVVLAPRSVRHVQKDLYRVGMRLGLADRATRVVAAMQHQVDVLRRSRPTEPVRIYLEWWPRPMFSPGRDSYADELITLAGGINVFGERPGASVRIEPAELVAADPELCFVSWCGVAEDGLDPDRLIRRPGLEALPAARAGRVYRLDERYSGRPGPHMLEAARRMAAAIEASGVRRG